MGVRNWEAFLGRYTRTLGLDAYSGTWGHESPCFPPHPASGNAFQVSPTRRRDTGNPNALPLSQAPQNRLEHRGRKITPPWETRRRHWGRRVPERTSRRRRLRTSQGNFSMSIETEPAMTRPGNLHVRLCSVPSKPAEGAPHLTERTPFLQNAVAQCRPRWGRGEGRGPVGFPAVIPHFLLLVGRD